MLDIINSIAALSVRIGKANIGLLEALAIPAEIRQEKLTALKSFLGIAELVYAATCNRVEFYVILPEGQNITTVRNRILDFFFKVENRSMKIDFEPTHFCLYSGKDAVRHLFEVTASLDSVVIGEAQVLGQMKEAHRFCSDSGLCGPILGRLFAASFKTAKTVRTGTELGRRPISMASLVMVKADEILRCRPAAVIAMVGSGPITVKLARSIRKKHDNPILFANRTPSKVAALAKQYNGLAVGLDQLLQQQHRVTVMISATSSPEPLFTLENLEKLIPDGGRLHAFDLAIPRDFAPDIAASEKIDYWDIEALNRLSQTNRRERFKVVDEAVRLIDSQVRQYIRKELSQIITPLIQSAAEESREAALESLQRLFDSKLSHLSAADRETLLYWGNKAISRASFLPAKHLAEEIISADGGHETLKSHRHGGPQTAISHSN
ncbi:MAG: glutamyl-tRNA reductase [Candidatus Zixiibacteriota bacterium]|nr:MAG: glutamyl-tRNA reductase [candidate division Zixibacteria bacterium]